MLIFFSLYYAYDIINYFSDTLSAWLQKKSVVPENSSINELEKFMVANMVVFLSSTTKAMINTSEVFRECFFEALHLYGCVNTKTQTNKKTTADGIIIPRYVLQKAALHVKGPADIVSI